MSEIEEVQEQMKADMDAMKDQMAAMMEAMLSMKKIMESNTAAVATTSAATEVDPTYPSGLNQVNPLVSNIVGQGGKNVDNSAPIPIESQQPQSDHAHVSQAIGETHEAPRNHNLADFKPHLRCSIEGQVVGGVPLPNTSGGPQYHPQPQPLNFVVGRVFPAMMVGYTPSSFADLVFAGDKIEVGMKRCKFDHPALMNRKPGANRENKNEGGTYTVTAIPTWPNSPPAQQCQYYWINDVPSLVLFEQPSGCTLHLNGSIRDVPSLVLNIATQVDVPSTCTTKDVPSNVLGQRILRWEREKDISGGKKQKNSQEPFHYPPPYQPRTPNHPQRPPLNQQQSPPAEHSIPNTTLNTNQNTNQGRNFPAKKPVKFTPIPMPYAELLPYMLNNAMVAITPAKVPQPPFFRGYNSNATCAYHGGFAGHSIEHCMTLKHKVQSLIDAG
ncbi:hypothetical protein HKD37_02G004412 [Glycine soja]